MKILRLSELDEKERSRLVSRSLPELDRAKEAVSGILRDVKKEGDKALVDYTAKFDKTTLKRGEIRVKKSEIEEAYRLVSKEGVEALRRVIRNLETVNRKLLPSKDIVEVEDGMLVWNAFRPIRSAGIYAPGGRASYPSTVLMAAVPAKVAGVKRLVLCTPPLPNKKVNPYTLVAADMTEVDDVYKVGGAQAIAAMAYGTETVPKVDKIVGPGNVYVTAAKLMVTDEVGIDFPAGPSEVLIVADETVDASYLAMDLISQAEHDPDSSAMLVTPSLGLAKKVQRLVEAIAKEVERRNVVEECLSKNGAIIVTESLESALDFANEYAPEHLELVIERPERVFDKIENAGTVFVGPYSPVPLGDYYSGSSHILPTGRCARIYSGLSARDFLREITFQMATKEALRRARKVVKTLTEIEGLPSHMRAVEERFKDGS